MGYGDYIRDLLRPLGVYDLDGGVFSPASLAAKGAALDGCAGELDRVAREMVDIGTRAFRYQCLSLPLGAVITYSNMLFQSAGKPLQATFIAATRQGIYFIPLILILPCFFGLQGVEFTQCISDALSFLSCIPLLIPFFRTLRERSGESA